MKKREDEIERKKGRSDGKTKGSLEDCKQLISLHKRQSIYINGHI